MNLPDGLFARPWVGSAHLVYAVVLAYAVWCAPWRRLRDSEQLNAFLGTCVALMVLWSLRAGVSPGLNFHLLGATLMVLMFDWPLAVVGQGVVLTAVTLSGHSGLYTVSLTALLATVVPVIASVAVHRLVVRYLPRHFFVYVFVNGFLNAAVAMAVTGVVSALVFAAAGVYPWAQLTNEYLPYYLLMIFPEAILTGSTIAMMVVYRPGWVATFDDTLYLRHK
jgi:uncharacterized membrane protein